MFCMALDIQTQYPLRRLPEHDDMESDSHLDLSRAPYCCVLYGVKYIDPVSLAPLASFQLLPRTSKNSRQPSMACWVKSSEGPMGRTGVASSSSTFPQAAGASTHQIPFFFTCGVSANTRRTPFFFSFLFFLRGVWQPLCVAVSSFLPRHLQFSLWHGWSCSTCNLTALPHLDISTVSPG